MCFAWDIHDVLCNARNAYWDYVGVFMIEHEHHEITQADYNELVFPEDCRRELRKMGYKPIETYTVKEHPLTQDKLPRAQPCRGIVPTHYLRFIHGDGYVPVPLPQYERDGGAQR